MAVRLPGCHFAVNHLLLLVCFLLLAGCADQTPPVLAAAPPHSTLRGPVTISIHTEPDAVCTTRIDDGPPAPLSGTDWHIDTADLPDGEHTAVITATDAAGNISTLALPLTTDNTPPALTLTATPGQQGRSMALFVEADEPLAALSGLFLERERTFYPTADGRFRTLVGVAIQQEAGEHAATVTATDAIGNTTTADLPVVIATTDFPRGGYIRLSKAQTAARKDEPARARTRKERGDAYTVRTDTALWSGPMLKPIEGRRTSGFGRYRTYSDGRRSYHYGTDLANITGTPVRAAADGVVLHAGWQHIFGNVVILDHGQGVSTSYNHLSGIDVTPGASVRAGEEIGQVGSTGQSTGPHLHWGLVVDGVSVDAEQWLAPLPWD